ncbi:MAG TPA: hypothetical protein VLT81_16410 [Chondromyces sp.]|nr:hypothetical protein [Chondromyces sp.]
MYLSGLTHRDRLFDIAMRWLADRVEPEDGQVLTEIFAFERAITAPTVRRFVADLCRVHRREDLYLERTTNKDELREAIVAAAAHPTSRVAELIDWYRQLPEEFFPRTPVRMSIVTQRNGRLAAVIRRKRIRRIADKVSRRVAAQLSVEVDAVAGALAASRPRNSGTVITNDRPPSAPAGIRGAAERLVADRIRSGRITLDPEKQRVDDVIGVKVIARSDELTRIEGALDELDYGWAHDREVHAGAYNGIHYLVDLELPPNEAILDSMRGIDWSFAARRGLAVAELDRCFSAYVDSCSRTFRVELILTTFEDLVESEFGTCIHEQRILDQRDLASDFGRLAQNASSIIEYMLRLATSPTVDIEELPFKIWGRYIRDTVAHKIAALGDGEPTEWLVPSEHLENLMQL